jgi:molybdopterin/thiamine biosynthesis adenylyltransferase
MVNSGFDYGAAFSRNLGWVTEDEQGLLRSKRIAIAGMGGVGGIHMLTLARLGVGGFRIADFDRFDIVNFNRQAGATMASRGALKAETLAAMARDINPALDLEVWVRPVDESNASAFLTGVDLYVDGLDFFAFDAREAVFAACHSLGVPAVTAAPLGMGTAVLNFLPGGMTFEEYFGFSGCSDEEKAIRFLLGLSPGMLQRTYLADPSRVDLAHRKGPSTIMACQLCAGAAGVEALKILLGRGRPRAAPWSYQFDAYRGRFISTWRPGGHRNPLQRLGRWIARRQLSVMARKGPANA